MTTETRDSPAAPEVRERTASDVLLAAARYIEEHGWCQGVAQDDEGRVCLVGAIMAVDGSLPPGQRLSDLGCAAWRRLDKGFRGAPSAWNDTPGRTEAEVLAALRAAAS